MLTLVAAPWGPSLLASAVAVVVWPYLGQVSTVFRIIIRRHPVGMTAATVFLIALVVRLVYLDMTIDNPSFAWVDPDRYARSGRLLTENGTWRWTIEAVRYQGSYFKAPLYPVFLSVFSWCSDYLWSAAMAECILSAVCAVAIFFAGRTIHSNRCGVLGAVAYTVYYPSVSSLTAVMQERLYVPILMMALAMLAWSVVRPRRPLFYALAGALLGLAALTRSMPIYFIAPAAVYCWVQGIEPKRGLVHAAALLGGFLVIVAPYCALLAAQSNQVIAIENIGGFGILRAYPAGRDFVASETPSFFEILQILWHQFHIAPLDYLRDFVRIVLASLQSNVGRGLEWSSSFPTAGEALGAKVLGHATGDLLFLAAIAMAPIGVVFAKQRAPASLLGLWIAIHLCFTALAGYGGPRFRQPIEPVLFVLAACVVAGDWRRTSRTTLAVAAVLAVLLAWPALRTLPSSLASRADYGVGVWRTTDSGRMASTTAEPAGFNLRSTAMGIEVRIWALQPSGGEAQLVEVRVDGNTVFEGTLDESGQRLRYDSSAGRLHFVELVPKVDAVAPHFGVELFDHPAGAGR